MSLLEAKDNDFGVVIWPLTHGQVEVAVDFLSCKQTYMMDLKTKNRDEIKKSTSVNEYDLSKFFTYN